MIHAEHHRWPTPTISLHLLPRAAPLQFSFLVGTRRIMEPDVGYSTLLVLVQQRRHGSGHLRFLSGLCACQYQTCFNALLNNQGSKNSVSGDRRIAYWPIYNHNNNNDNDNNNKRPSQQCKRRRCKFGSIIGSTPLLPALSLVSTIKGQHGNIKAGLPGLHCVQSRFEADRRTVVVLRADGESVNLPFTLVPAARHLTT